VLLVLAVVLTGCVTPVLPEKIAAAKSLAIISAVEPDVVGQTVGFTVFGNGWWMSNQVGVDTNAIILDTIKANLKRDVRLVHGREVGFYPERQTENLGDLYKLLASEDTTKANRDALMKFGREWGVEKILLIQSGQLRDWMRKTSVPIYGVGHFSGGNNWVFAVLRLKVFDCATGDFKSGAVVGHALRIEGVEWRKSWAEYSTEDQRAVRRAMPIVLRETVPYLMVRAGLASEPLGEPPLVTNFAGVEFPPSIVPSGNVISIPNWASVDQAREAVLFAFKEREWTVIKDADGVLVGTHPKGKKLAVCTARIADRKISMTPECFEIKADGSRLPVEYIERWHENLKESLFGYLLAVPNSAQN